MKFQNAEMVFIQKKAGGGVNGSVYHLLPLESEELIEVEEEEEEVEDEAQ
jgi:hypothetical protein